MTTRCIDQESLERLERDERLLLNAEDVARFMGVDPHSIRCQAHIDHTKLGFPVIVLGHRVRIPRVPFIKFLKGELIYALDCVYA